MTSNLKSKIGLTTTFSVLTVWALAAGYFQAFSIFPPYDDEGYLMITVKQFLNGGVLYDQVYTQYGPAYYLYQWLSHNLSGLPVTHDATRLTTLVLWTLTAMFCGIFTFRLTRSAIFSAISYVLTFLILFRTVYEPGHPQEICGILIVFILLLLTDGKTENNFYARLTILAALLAGLCLIKINLGIFVGLGLTVAFLAFSTRNLWQRIALYAAAALALLLPFIMFRKYFAVGWLKLCVLIAVMVISTIISGTLRSDKVEIYAKHYFLMTAAFCATVFLIVLFVLLKGTSFDALLQGVLLQHLKFGDDFFQPAPIQRFAIFWGVFALAFAAILAYLRQKYVSVSEVVVDFSKIGYGLFVILCSLFGYTKFTNTFLLLSFATPLLWLLTFEARSGNTGQNNKLAKTALIFVAVLLSLQIFPIAGTQMAYGSFLMSVVGVICLSDGCKNLKNILPKKFESPYLPPVLTTVAAGLLVLLCTARFYDNYKVYYQQIPVKFYGTTRLRLPEQDAALYNFLVENLKSQCDSFISMPGILSLNFWSEIEPPTTFNSTAWMTLLTDVQQRTIVEKLKSSPRVCAVYQPQLTYNGARNHDLATLPLSGYLLTTLQTRATVSDYQFMTQKDVSGNLVYAAKIVPNERNAIIFTLPKQFESTIARVQLFDSANRRIIADSQEISTQIFDIEGKTSSLPITISRDKVNVPQYIVKFSPLNFSDLPEPQNLYLRFFDGAGNLTNSLPFYNNP